MGKINKKHLAAHLEQLEAEDLREELMALYAKFDQVKEYYQVELSGVTNPVLDQYKKKIYIAYFPKRGRGRRKNSITRKLISDFKKVSAFDADLADLLLYRVECAVQCANTTIQRQDTYYNPVVASFNEALRLMVNGGFWDHYKERIERVLSEAVNEFFPLRSRLQDLADEYEQLQEQTT